MTSRVTGVLIWAWVGVLAGATTLLPFLDSRGLDYFLLPAPLTMVLGALILTKVPGNRIGLVMLTGGSAWLLYVIGRRYALLSLEEGPLPGEYLAAWLGNWLGPFFLLSFPTLLVLFPDGKVSGWRRWFVGVLGLIASLAVAGGVALWGSDIAVLTDDSLADASPSYAITDLAFLLGLWASLPATFSVFARFRRGNRQERQQIKWLLVGASIFAMTLAFAPILEGSDLWAGALAVGMSLFPVAVGIAVFRYRLYDLGRIVSRTVSYAIVVAVLGTVFVIGVVFVPNQLMGVENPPAPFVAASTLAAAALFNPIRRWAMGWIDRRFNRSHYDAGRVMDRFAGSLREQVDGGDLIDGWVGVVEETMQPSSVAVWVRS
jgi:hypothetical protein